MLSALPAGCYLALFTSLFLPLYHFMKKRSPSVIFAFIAQFLGAFAKLRKATITFVMSVRLSFRMQQLGSRWTGFYEIVFFFENV